MRKRLLPGKQLLHAQDERAAVGVGTRARRCTQAHVWPCARTACCGACPCAAHDASTNQHGSARCQRGCCSHAHSCISSALAAADLLPSQGGEGASVRSSECAAKGPVAAVAAPCWLWQWLSLSASNLLPSSVQPWAL